MAYVIFSRVSDAKTTSSGTEMPMIQPVVGMVWYARTFLPSGVSSEK